MSTNVYHRAHDDIFSISVFPTKVEDDAEDGSGSGFYMIEENQTEHGSGSSLGISYYDDTEYESGDEFDFFEQDIAEHGSSSKSIPQEDLSESSSYS